MVPLKSTTNNKPSYGYVDLKTKKLWLLKMGGRKQTQHKQELLHQEGVKNNLGTGRIESGQLPISFSPPRWAGLFLLYIKRVRLVSQAQQGKEPSQ